MISINNTNKLTEIRLFLIALYNKHNSDNKDLLKRISKIQDDIRELIRLYGSHN